MWHRLLLVSMKKKFAKMGYDQKHKRLPMMKENEERVMLLSSNFQRKLPCSAFNSTEQTRGINRRFSHMLRASRIEQHKSFTNKWINGTILVSGREINIFDHLAVLFQ
jgi:hypothetical protein